VLDRVAEVDRRDRITGDGKFAGHIPQVINALKGLNVNIDVSLFVVIAASYI
jgi:hypothetical protein